MNSITVAGVEWFWFTRRFPSATMAKRIFEDVYRYSERKQGKLDTGLYRHGTHAEGMVYISGVSHQPDGIRQISNRVGGLDVEMEPTQIQALVLRRARVIMQLSEQGAGGGSYRVPHPDGSWLWSDGGMEDDA